MTSSDSPWFIVFSDDWGRHPSSCQHLFRQLFPKYRTHWVNTIGMRRPGLNLSTVKRGLEKLGQWTRRKPESETQALPENLTVSNPRMWPSFASWPTRRLNRWLLTRHLRQLSRERSEPPIAVTTIPIVSELISVFPDWRWAYYCVDDFGEWPGIDQKTMQKMEKRLVAECHRIIAVSDTLKTKLADMGRESLLLTHGVDLEHWKRSDHLMSLPQLEGLERPLIVFWGVIDRRMDVSWVQHLGASMDQGTIVLAGPLAEPDPALFHAPHVKHVPPLPFDHLPSLAKETSVLIMPYDDLPVTRAMQPLKLKEYLATGLPTVVRDLPSNREWADCMDMLGSKEEFVTAVRQRLDQGLPGEQADARLRLEAESWSAKAKLFEDWLLADAK